MKRKAERYDRSSDLTEILAPDASKVLENSDNDHTLNRRARNTINRILDCRRVAISDLKPPPGRETRKHPPSQIVKIADCLKEFGQVAPILIDPHKRVVAGWAIVVAARRLDLREIQVVCVSDLSDAKLRSLRLALNKLPEYARWDPEALKLEISEIRQTEPEINLADSGFEVAEIDSILDDGGLDQEDELPELDEQARPITQIGDQWILGDHVIRCGDALDPQSFEYLLASERAGMVFTDPPYNVKLFGNVTRSRSARSHDSLWPRAS